MYRAGNFVDLEMTSTDALDRSASPVILHIIEIKADYTLVLRGRDGCVIIDHVRSA